MGRNLEAHRQRYLDSGDFPAYWLGFDAALKDDALAAPLLAEGLNERNAAWLVLYLKRTKAEPPTFTPEELLAALEPPEVVVERKEPLTLEQTWNAFTNRRWNAWSAWMHWSNEHPFVFLILFTIALFFLIGLFLARS